MDTQQSKLIATLESYEDFEILYNACTADDVVFQYLEKLSTQSMIDVICFLYNEGLIQDSLFKNSLLSTPWKIEDYSRLLIIILDDSGFFSKEEIQRLVIKYLIKNNLDLKYLNRIHKFMKKIENIKIEKAIRETKYAQIVITTKSLTDYAVAVSYNKDKQIVVIASGIDNIAVHIKREALKYDIPVIEHPPLARTLYGDISIGQQVSEQLKIPAIDILEKIK